MHILAAFFDPNNNGFDLTDLGAVIILVLTVWGSVWGALTWNGKRVAAARTKERLEMEQRIRDTVEQMTKPIQPQYRNDGGSLRDVADKIDVVIERQAHISDRLDKHIDWHMNREEDRR